MELQPQWSLYFPQPHYRTRSREKIALLHLCADPVHTLLLWLFNTLRPLPLAQSPGCVSCPSSPALSQCLTSLPHHKHQLKPPANSAASCRLHGLSRMLLSLAVYCYMPFCLVRPQSHSSLVIVPEGGHAGPCPLNPTCVSEMIFISLLLASIWDPMDLIYSLSTGLGAVTSRE